MSVRAYYREDLALAQLKTALRLFFEGSDLASVITLAGASDEVFGKLLSATGRTNALDELKKAVTAIHITLSGEPLEPSEVARRANRAKNSLKHWDEGQDQIVKLDLHQEARDMLFRATDNYWALKQSLTPAMERFQRESMAA
jgi:hypothetical protein